MTSPTTPASSRIPQINENSLYTVFNSKRDQQCQNIFFHRGGKIFGAKQLMNAVRWREHEGRYLLLGPRGKVRFILEPIDDGFRGKSIEPPQHAEEIKDLTIREPEFVMTKQPPFPDDKRLFEVIVAKYREDVSWVECCAPIVTVYSKRFGDPEYIDMPNLGYECSTYFHHIVSRYDQLARRTLFLQGNPFPHPLFPLWEYAARTEYFVAAGVHTNDMDFVPHWAKPGQRIDGGVLRAFLELIEYHSEVPSIQWTWGAQFSIAREQIQRRPRDYYQRMLELTQKPVVEIAGRQFDDKHVAYLLEFFWRQVFLVTSGASKE